MLLSNLGVTVQRFLSVALVVIAIASCSGSRDLTPHGSPDRGSLADSALFSAVVRLMSADTTARLRASERPLRRDSTWYFSEVVVPTQGASPYAYRRTMSHSDSILAATRANILTRFGIEKTELIDVLRCPPAQLVTLEPDSMEADRRQWCPQGGRVQVIAVTIPTDDFEKSAEFDKKDVLVVRVISRIMSEYGAAGKSADFFYEHRPDGSWFLLKTVGVLYVD